MGTRIRNFIIFFYKAIAENDNKTGGQSISFQNGI